jgi:multidrug efflux system membrane fusion protein
MPVGVAVASKKTLDIYINALGTVTPLGTVVVHSRVDGELTRVLFKEGQLVKQGDLLAQIDPRPFQVQLTQANGQLARDQALLKNAEVDLERYRTLLEQDSASKQQVDTQEALVRQYRAALQIDEGQIDSAKLQLTYASVTAPISGRIGLRQVDQGNIVHASDANGLVVITQLNPITVIFAIPEDNLSKLARQILAGATLPAQAWDRAGTKQLAVGSLTTFDNQVDPTTGTVKLKAQFSNDNATLFANQFVNIKLRVDQLDDATVVPIAAIQRGQQGTYVYVVGADQAVAVRPVRLSVTQDDQAAIGSGLQPGESVVIDGADKLRDGAKVQPISPDDRAKATAGTDSTKPRRGEHRNGDPSKRKHDPNGPPSGPPSGA